MKFFLSFLQGKPGHPIPAYSFWEYYIKNGIEEAGHQWIEEFSIDWAEGLIYRDNSTEMSQWKAKVWEKAVESIKKNRPSVFLSYLYPKQIDIPAIKEIQRLGVPCINFFCDHVREFKLIPKAFHVFDLNWVPEIEATELYKKANLNYIHLPMPMWVDPKFRFVEEKSNSSITFIGSRDIQRTLLFNELLTKYQNSDLRIYGKGWIENDTHTTKFQENQNLTAKIKNQMSSLMKNGLASYLRRLQQRNLTIFPSQVVQQHCRGTIDFDEYINITKNSFITLGVNRYPNTNYPLYRPHSYSRLRDIEAPMLGACYITENASDLDLFYPKEHLLTYKNTDGIIENINLLKSFSAKDRLNYIKKLQNIAINELNIPNSLSKINKKIVC